MVVAVLSFFFLSSSLSACASLPIYLFSPLFFLIGPALVSGFISVVDRG